MNNLIPSGTYKANFRGNEHYHKRGAGIVHVTPSGHIFGADIGAYYHGNITAQPQDPRKFNVVLHVTLQSLKNMPTMELIAPGSSFTLTGVLTGNPLTGHFAITGLTDSGVPIAADLEKLGPAMQVLDTTAIA